MLNFCKLVRAPTRAWPTPPPPRGEEQGTGPREVPSSSDCPYAASGLSVLCPYIRVCCPYMSGRFELRLSVQDRERWLVAAGTMKLGLSGFVRVAVEAFIEASGLPVAAHSKETTERLIAVPTASAFVPAREEPQAVVESRPPVGVGALLERGRENRARVDERGLRSKMAVGKMCEHRRPADQFCKQCDGEAT